MYYDEERTKFTVNKCCYIVQIQIHDKFTLFFRIQWNNNFPQQPNELDCICKITIIIIVCDFMWYSPDRLFLVTIDLAPCHGPR